MKEAIDSESARPPLPALSFQRTQNIFAFKQVQRSGDLTSGKKPCNFWPSWHLLEMKIRYHIYILSLAAFAGFGCAGKATVPAQELWSVRVPGHWRTAPSVLYKADVPASTLHVDCDGKMEYDLRYNPVYRAFGDVKSHGSIQAIHEKEIEYTNALGLPKKSDFEAPRRDEKGCWRMKIFDLAFQSSNVLECPSDRPSYREALRKLGDHVANSMDGKTIDPCDPNFVAP